MLNDIAPAPPPPHVPEDLADALSRVAPVVTRWMERLLAAGEPRLTLAQLEALRAIERGGAGATDLARRAGVSAAAVSQTLAGLEAAGLIRRASRASEDRRRLALALTGEGARALASADRALRERLGALLGGLPRPEADALRRSLPAVEALLSGGDPPPRRPPPRPPAPRPPR